MKVKIRVVALDFEELNDFEFEMDLETLPRTEDEFTLVGNPDDIYELTGAEEFYGSVDRIEWEYDVSGKLNTVILYIIVNDEIEEELYETLKERKNGG